MKKIRMIDYGIVIKASAIIFALEFILVLAFVDVKHALLLALYCVLVFLFVMTIAYFVIKRML